MQGIRRKILFLFYAVSTLLCRSTKKGNNLYTWLLGSSGRSCVENKVDKDTVMLFCFSLFGTCKAVVVPGRMVACVRIGLPDHRSQPRAGDPGALRCNPSVFQGPLPRSRQMKSVAMALSRPCVFGQNDNSLPQAATNLSGRRPSDRVTNVRIAKFLSARD